MPRSMQTSAELGFITLRDVFQVRTWPMWCSSSALLQLPDATANTLPLQFHDRHVTGRGAMACSGAEAVERDLGASVRRT